MIAIVDEPTPDCPPGGLLVQTEASGLCSGELMDWYMDRKIPHVLGHEVAGKVVESNDERFPVGARVFVHHHAPCMSCELCSQGLHVHCPQWKRTKLIPGGMAEFFAVSQENLTDTLIVDDLRPIDAALIEPLACVLKGIRLVMERWGGKGQAAVIGLGGMGVMHSLLLGPTLPTVGYDTNPDRTAGARTLGIEARDVGDSEPADMVFVCPGNKAALDTAIGIVKPGGSILLFAPMPPGNETPVDLNSLYFKDVRLINSYSCGPVETRLAADALRRGDVRAEQVVSDFIAIEELPEAYQKMKRGEILKAMVVF